MFLPLSCYDIYRDQVFLPFLISAAGSRKASRISQRQPHDLIFQTESLTHRKQMGQGFAICIEKSRAENSARLSVSKNPFQHAGGLLKKSQKPSNSRLSAYIDTVGRELRWKSKSLRSKQDRSKNRSLYVILRNEVTKNLFAVDTARILRIRSG